MKTRFCARPRAFTLIELLTVIAIIGILAAILIPVVGNVRDSAHSAKTVSKLRQLHQANRMHAADWKGLFYPVAALNLQGTDGSAQAQYHVNPYFQAYLGSDRGNGWNAPQSLMKSGKPGANGGS